MIMFVRLIYILKWNKSNLKCGECGACHRAGSARSRTNTCRERDQTTCAKVEGWVASHAWVMWDTHDVLYTKCGRLELAWEWDCSRFLDGQDRAWIGYACGSIRQALELESTAKPEAGSDIGLCAGQDLGHGCRGLSQKARREPGMVVGSRLGFVWCRWRRLLSFYYYYYKIWTKVEIARIDLLLS